MSMDKDLEVLIKSVNNGAIEENMLAVIDPKYIEVRRQYEQGLKFLNEPINIDKAIKYFEEAASQGNAQAMNRLGLIYLYDKNPQDRTKSSEYFKNAAFRGNSLALNNFNFIEGKENQSNYWLSANEEKYTEMEYNLSLIYKRRNNEKEESYKKRIKIIEDSAKSDNIEASYNLSMAYKYGLYPNQKIPDYENQIKYLEIAASKGDTKSQSELGLIYKGLFPGQQKNLEKAYNYLKLAADKNDPRALCNLGNMYSKGEVPGLNGKPDFKKALELYKASAINSKINENGIAIPTFNLTIPPENGNIVPLNNIGTMYLKGEFPGQNGKPNFEQAAKYFEIGVKKGDIESLFKLGYMFYKGEIGKINGKQDYNKALNLFKLAAKKGDAMSRNIVEKIYKKTKIEQTKNLSSNTKSFCEKLQEKQNDKNIQQLI